MLLNIEDVATGLILLTAEATFLVAIRLSFFLNLISVGIEDKIRKESYSLDTSRKCKDRRLFLVSREVGFPQSIFAVYLLKYRQLI